MSEIIGNNRDPEYIEWKTKRDIERLKKVAKAGKQVASKIKEYSDSHDKKNKRKNKRK